MSNEEAIRYFEKVRFIDEQIDMEKEINNCCYILSQSPVDVDQVKQEIYVINAKHPENQILFRLIFPPKGETIQLSNASDANLIEDLKWKLYFLQAKKSGKAFDEFCKTMREMIQENQNGGNSNGQNEI